MRGALAVGRGLPAPFWWLFAGMLAMTSASFVLSFLALYLTSRGEPASTTGLVMAFHGLGSLPAGPVAGAITDRLGRRPALVGSLVGTALLTAALAFIDSLPLLAADVLLLGFVSHGWWPPSGAVIADVVPPERQGEAFGLLHWVRNAGYSLSAVVGGALATSGFGKLFVLDAITTLAFAALVLLRLPETRPAAPAAHAHGPGFTAALADRHLVAVLALTLVTCLALFQFLAALPIVMARAGISPAVYGRVVAVNGVLIFLLQPWFSARAGGLRPGPVLAVSALLVAAGTGGYALARTAPGFAVATAVWSLGEIAMMPVLSGLVARLAPPHLRGSYQGALGLAFGVGLGLAPLLGGELLERAGATALWGACAAVGLVAAAGHLAAARARGELGPA